MSFNLSERVIVIGNVFDETCLEPLLKLVSKSFELADKMKSNVGVYIYGTKAEYVISHLRQYNLDTIYLLAPDINNPFDSEFRILERELQMKMPDIVLFLASEQNKILASRLGVMLRTGLTADCIDLEIDPLTNKLLQIRPAFQGNLLAKIECKREKMQMAIVNPEQFCNTLIPKQSNPKIQMLHLNEKQLSKCSLLESTLIMTGNSTQKKYIVTIGRGVSSIENRDLILRFAKKIGAGIGATRAAVAMGLMDEKYQIGLTGKKISCNINFMFGVSGAIQHMIGLQSVKTLIAINNDKEAPVFHTADYGIYGDIRVAADLLLKKFESTGEYI